MSVVNPITIYTRVELDISTGEDRARIDGTSGFFGGCGIVRPFRADSLTIDAGPLQIQAICSVSDPFDPTPTISYARFNFVAERGHTYTFSPKGAKCLNLLDVTTNALIGECQPYFYGRYVDLSTGYDTAIIMAGAASSDKGDCQPKTGPGRFEKADFLEVDAGPISIKVQCKAANSLNIWGRRVSSFEFTAETGHTYTITATDKECMTLLDVTSEEFVIACEPYEQHDEEK